MSARLVWKGATGGGRARVCSDGASGTCTASQLTKPTPQKILLSVSSVVTSTAAQWYSTPTIAWKEVQRTCSPYGAHASRRDKRTQPGGRVRQGVCGQAVQRAGGGALCESVERYDDKHAEQHEAVDERQVRDLRQVGGCRVPARKVGGAGGTAKGGMAVHEGGRERCRVCLVACVSCVLSGGHDDDFGAQRVGGAHLKATAVRGMVTERSIFEMTGRRSTRKGVSPSNAITVVGTCARAALNTVNNTGAKI